jgi:hypothetical protein
MAFFPNWDGWWFAGSTLGSILINDGEHWLGTLSNITMVGTHFHLMEWCQALLGSTHSLGGPGHRGGVPSLVHNQSKTLIC